MPFALAYGSRQSFFVFVRSGPSRRTPLSGPVDTIGGQIMHRLGNAKLTEHVPCFPALFPVFPEFCKNHLIRFPPCLA